MRSPAGRKCKSFTLSQQALQTQYLRLVLSPALAAVMWLQQFDHRRVSSTQAALVEAASLLLRLPLPEAAQALATDFYGSLRTITTIGSAEGSKVSDEDALRLGRVLQRAGFSFEASFAHGGHTRELHDAVMYAVQQLTRQKNRIPVAIHNVAVAVDGSMLSYAALDAAAHLCKHGKLFVVNIVEEDAELPSLAREYMLADFKRRCKHQYKIPDDRVEIIVVACEKYGTEDDLHSQLAVPARKLQEVLLQHDVRVVALGTQGQHQTSGFGRFATWATYAANPFSCVLTNSFSKKCALNQSRIAYKFLMPLPPQLQSIEQFREFWASSLQLMHPGDSLLILCLQCSSQGEGEGTCEPTSQQEFWETLHDMTSNATIEVVVRNQVLDKQHTAAQEALHVVEQEGVHAILLPRKAGTVCPHVAECCGAARCTVALV